jgi:DNA-binding transcriptional regulator YhcF (GntR family)
MSRVEAQQCLTWLVKAYHQLVTTAVEQLESLDPDDSRPASQQIAGVLRAAIRTGRFAPGDRLPSQHELAERYAVARETVKTALRMLRDERLVVTRQGSGAFVRSQSERPVGLRPHIEAAFDRKEVSIDFAGFSGETLLGVLGEPLDKIRAGRLTPESIKIRMLLPDPEAPMSLPARANGPMHDPAVRERSRRITSRAVEGIGDALRELAELDLVRSASVETRVYATSPLFKLYVINEEEAFFGFYPVARHTVTIDSARVSIFDPMGKDATMFHFTTSEDDPYNLYVDEARAWFESIWTTVARERAE